MRAGLLLPDSELYPNCDPKMLPADYLTPVRQFPVAKMTDDTIGPFVALPGLFRSEPRTFAAAATVALTTEVRPVLGQ
jgi:hypothetical protein